MSGRGFGDAVFSLSGRRASSTLMSPLYGYLAWGDEAGVLLRPEYGFRGIPGLTAVARNIRRPGSGACPLPALALSRKGCSLPAPVEEG